MQASVSIWLDLIGLSRYDQALNDAGYDDIDFISDITSEELEDIGITKKGGCGRTLFSAGPYRGVVLV